jgi:hypothetical protein
MVVMNRFILASESGGMIEGNVATKQKHPAAADCMGWEKVSVGMSPGHIGYVCVNTNEQASERNPIVPYMTMVPCHMN